MEIIAIPAEVHRLLADTPRRHDKPHRAEVRELVVTYARARRAEGWTWKRVAAELPVSTTAVSKWLRAAEPRLVPVVVRGELLGRRATRTESSSLTLTSPSGWRVEGLVMEELATLLARLP